MGQLLKAMREGNSGTSGKVDIFVDFENAKPTDSEKGIYDEVLNILKIAPQLMEDMKGYGGASVEIREAIQNPSDNDRQDKAWEVILCSVKTLKTFWLFSEDLAQVVVPRLLSGLCNTSMNPQEHLETQQALAKLLAETIQFVLLFDDLKMTTPSIQNDFSYYRRSMNRRSMSQLGAANFDDGGITQEQANSMAMFFANAMPMLSCLTRGTASFLFGHPEIPMEHTTDCLSTFSTVCRVMIANPEYSSRFKNRETSLFCLRVMTGTIILYDHIHPDGAFAKTSKIDIKESIRTLQTDPSSCENLMNALRYNTKHLHDDATPKAIKSLLC